MLSKIISILQSIWRLVLPGKKSRSPYRMHNHKEFAALLDGTNPASQTTLKELKAAEKTYGPRHSTVAFSLNGLGMLYITAGKYAEAEEVLQRALDIGGSLGPPHLTMTLDRLGSLRRAQGKLEEAQSFYQKELSLLEEGQSIEDGTLLACLENLGGLYEDQGRYAEAEPFYDRALMICETSEGLNSFGVMKFLNRLGELHLAQKQHLRAEAFFQRCRDINREKEFRLGLAESLARLSDIYRETGREEDAHITDDQVARIYKWKMTKSEITDLIRTAELMALYKRRFGKITEASLEEARVQRLGEFA